MILFIAFLSPMFYATAVLIESLLSNYTFKHQTTMIFYISMMNCVFLPLVLFFGHPTLPQGNMLRFYLLLAVIDVGYLYPYYSAMKVIDTSIVSALFALGQVIVPILSFLILREVLNLHQYIGFMIIILASIALSIKGDKVPKLNRAFYYMMLSSFMLSSRIIFVKLVIKEEGNWVNLVFWPNLISGIIPLGLLFIKKYRKDIVKHFPPYLHKCPLFALNEFVYFWAVTTETYGVSKLSPVVSASIDRMEPIFLLAISGFLLYVFNIKLKEKITMRILLKKLFCFVLMILGVILVV